LNKDQARNFVKQTFTQAFDKTRFLDFAKNLVNHLDESKAASMQVPNAFKAHVRSCTRLGTYRSPRGELADVLIVNTTEPEKIERTRTALRDFVAHKLKREEDYKEAGIVAFVSPDERNWRFSYIRMEYQSTRDPDTGKIVAEERVTPARRFSYIVGEGESCHTAQARFLNLLQDTDHDPTLSEIEEAFSVEVVTKEFFTQYVKLFERINESLEKLAKKDKSVGEEFKTKGITTVDFAKKLLGQIVFLYFLQRKGWLGVDKGEEWGTGPRSFLRLLADRKYSTYDNFFNDVLEPLFYDTLATDRGHEAWCEQFNCRIPFLNGGLFEPPANYNWKKKDITLPNHLFTNDDYIDVGVSGTGVLDVFDRYNFTVNEAEPLETEVAIDPEMLGKVFENLIEENRRKGLGAFYTPREIVHYMCQESLINYLDNALNQAISKPMVPENAQQQQLFGKSKIPFAGKNPQQAALARRDRAVLIPREDIETFIRLGEQISHYESVETTYKIRMPKSIKDHARLIDEKLRDITVCDPAVGSAAFLVMMMMLIVRARVALTPYFTDVNERTPYHFKRHAILNSLYGVDIDAGAVEIAKLRLWLSLVVDEEDVNQIKPLPNLDYRVVVGNSLIGLPDDVLRDAKIDSELEWLRKELGNETDNERKREYREEIKKRVQPLLDSAEHYAGYKVNFDFKLFFSDVFHGRNGFDIVIANPPYVDVKGLPPETVRMLFDIFQTAKNRINLYAFFIEKSFALLNKEGTLAFINPNSLLVNESYTPLRKLILPTVIKLIKLPDHVFEKAVVETMLLFLSKNRNPDSVLGKQFRNNEQLNFQTVFFSKFSRSAWFQERECRFNISSQKELLDICKKMDQGTKPLESFFEFSLGITPYDKYKGHGKKLISERRFHADRKLSEEYVPLISGENILRYVILPKPQEWLKYGDWLGAPRERRFFTEPRIIVRQIISGIPPRIYAGYTQKHLYHAQVGFALLKRDSVATDLLFFLGILDSKLINLYHAEVFLDKEKVTFQKILIANCKKIPIRLPSSSQEKAIVDKTNQILAAKQRDSAADTTSLEREIDQLVYQLYGLTEEEIKIVENV